MARKTRKPKVGDPVRLIRPSDKRLGMVTKVLAYYDSHGWDVDVRPDGITRSFPEYIPTSARLLTMKEILRAYLHLEV